MPIPVEVYEALEDVLGKEPARKLVHGLEEAVRAVVTVQVTVLRDELLDKLVTKEVFLAHMEALWAKFQEQIQGLRAEFQTQIQTQVQGLRQEFQTQIQTQIQGLRQEFEERMTRLEDRVANLENRMAVLEGQYERLNLKMNFLILLLLLLMTVLNPTFVNLLKSLF